MTKSKILISFILFIGFLSEVKAQDYLDFDTYAEYDISCNTLDFLPTPIITYSSGIEEVYFSHTNTDGVLLYVGYLDWSLSIFSGEPSVSDFLIYTDSATKTVRLTKHNYNDSLYLKYAVLYDYNQMVGDTLHSDIMNPNNSGAHIITSIDTINYNGIDRRTFSVSGSSIKIIQGIGSSYGFIPIDITPFEGGCILDCAFMDGVHSYGTTCDMSVDEGIVEIKMNVFPNPTNGIVSVELDDNVLITDNEIWIEVMDVMGKVVDIRNVQNSIENLDLGNNPAGVYFVFLKMDGETVSSKKVILQP